MTLHSLATPAVLIFCETCCRWTPPVSEEERPHQTPQGLGLCELHGWKDAIQLCGDHRREPEKAPRRPPHQKPRLTHHMSHHMGPEATCSNHPRGQAEPVCGISWAEHQADPTPCLFERPEWGAALAAKMRAEKPGGGEACGEVV